MPPPRTTLRSRWLAHPGLSLLLAASWLLLQGSLEPAHLLAAAGLGLGLPRVLHRWLMLPPPATGSPSFRHTRVNWRPVPRLTCVVIHDIIKSGLIVARQSIGRMDALQPAWMTVPLQTRHPAAISLLATIITNTPGTISCHVDEAQGYILVHALHCTDAAATIADIRQRYESPLIRIFETRPVAPFSREESS